MHKDRKMRLGYLGLVVLVCIPELILHLFSPHEIHPENYSWCYNSGDLVFFFNVLLGLLLFQIFISQSLNIELEKTA